MRGHVYKRCACGPLKDEHGRRVNCRKGHGSWGYALTAGYGADGKRRQFTKFGFLTEREANAALNDLIDRLAKGTYTPSGATTVGTYLDEWLAGKVTLRPTTRRSYTEHVDLYLRPALGRIRLSDLRDTDIDSMYAAMRSLGHAEKVGGDVGRMAAQMVKARNQPPELVRPLSAARIRRVHATLMSALNSAVKRQRIATNPALHVELEAGRRPKALVWTDERVAEWKRTGKRPSAVMVWTPAQTGQFLDHSADDRLYALFHLIALRGLRRGEASGLRWSEVDLDQATVRVSSQRVQVGWAVEEGDPKADSHRTVALDQETVGVLRAHRRAQLQERLAADDWRDSGFVFVQPAGQPLHPGAVTAKFRRLVDAAGLPPIRLHDLRHGAATLALAGGVDMKVVQAMLGHSAMAITADTYTSVLPELGHKAAEAAAALVPRQRRGADD